MDVLIMAEKHDELLSDLPVEWLCARATRDHFSLVAKRVWNQ